MIYHAPVKLALVPLNPTVGALADNAAMIGREIAAARDAGCDLVVFPELALSGYPPKDLLLQQGFLQACCDHAKQVGEQHTSGITAIFGTPLPVDQKNYLMGIANSLLVYRDGKYLDYYDKRLLPTYDVFDEDRYFTPGDRAVVVEISGVKVGLAICEDLWKGEDAGFSQRYASAADPVAALTQAGAQIIICPSASPFVLGKGDKHRGIVRGHALRHRIPVVSLNQLGGNDELVFDGHAMAFGPDGSLLADGGEFTGKNTIVDVLTSKSASSSHFATLPLRHSATSSEHDLFHALTLGIRDYLRKTGFKKAILGLSGGIDSALTAVLAAAAIGPANVFGVGMPSKYSSDHSIADARDLAKRMGMPFQLVPIEEPVTGMRQVIDPTFAAQGLPSLGERLPDLTEENLQSRVRGTLLMALSNRTGAIVLTTGNKSELAVGYCTLYGDMNGGLAVLSDVSKQWIYRLSKWINSNATSIGFESAPIPESSINKAPSAELRPNQTDQDSLPPYEVLDEILERIVERRQSTSTVVRETSFDEAVVKRIARLIDLAEYKRKQAAIGLKVTSVAFGSGRRWPIAQGWRG